MRRRHPAVNRIEDVDREDSILRENIVEEAVEIVGADQDVVPGAQDIELSRQIQVRGIVRAC